MAEVSEEIKCEFGDPDCDPESQHPCWPHKVAHWRANGFNAKIPAGWRGPSAVELGKREVELAVENGWPREDIIPKHPKYRWV